MSCILLTPASKELAPSNISGCQPVLEAASLAALSGAPGIWLSIGHAGLSKFGTQITNASRRDLASMIGTSEPTHVAPEVVQPLAPRHTSVAASVIWQPVTSSMEASDNTACMWLHG